jgi:hypothetical protein
MTEKNKEEVDRPGVAELAVRGKSPADAAGLAIPDEPKHRCDTCRWWDVHSLEMRAGDCRAPGDHRYSRVLIESPRPNGSVYRSYAMLDSFGPETTLPGFVCGAWDDGYQAVRAALAKAAPADVSRSDSATPPVSPPPGSDQTSSETKQEGSR